MTLIDLARRTEKLLADNSPSILTGLGVTGTVMTAVFTGQATVKAVNAIAVHEQDARRLTGDSGYEMNTKAKFALVWKYYVPAVGTGLVAIGCIICANRIGVRRAAAMAAAYSISEKAFVEYKEKVVERLGSSKEQIMRDEISQDRVTQNPHTNREVIITGDGEVLCYDTITGRYFQSTVETLRKAQNDINAQILNYRYASLYDFFDLIGLPPTKYSHEVGWNLGTGLELHFSTVMSENNRPCVAINYELFPIREYNRLE